MSELCHDKFQCEQKRVAVSSVDQNKRKIALPSKLFPPPLPTMVKV